MNPLESLFAYKAWANEELFSTLEKIDAEQFPKEVHTAIRILNHVFVVDSIFKAHLEGRPHGYEATNTKQTPTLSALATAACETDAWFLDYVCNLSAGALQQKVHFSFTDGDSGTMTREEMLLHVATHGGYHRGSAGEVMRGTGTPPPRDLFTRFLHLSQPERRG
jgi:uncharacterized damage-inducible protein DinB